MIAGDEEDLDQALFNEARALYIQNPQPERPIDLVRLQPNSNINYASRILTSAPIQSSSQYNNSLSSSLLDPTTFSEEEEKLPGGLCISIGCSGQVTSEYMCTMCSRSLHYFCGALLMF